MSVSMEVWHSVVRFLGDEAAALDTRDWDRWLALYEPECSYWLPAWRSDGTLVEDPRNEISLIYYSSRVGLEGRVFRLRTGRVSSAQTLPRTLHQVQPVEMESTGSGLKLRTHWTAHSVYESRTASYFGYALYALVAVDGGWRIRSKKTVLLNDRIHEVLDFYNV